MGDTRKYIATTIREYLNENNIIPITLYHKIGGRQVFNIKERVKNVTKNGLIPHDAISGDYSEQGKIIWFSSDYDQYGDKGDFVLSIEYNRENIEKFNMNFDGQYCYIFNEIPFNELTVVKIPIIITNNNNTIINDFLIKQITKGLTPQALSKLINERNYEIFIDLFDGYVQPYINDENFVYQLKQEINPKFIITSH